jgi:hypothetical protein
VLTVRAYGMPVWWPNLYCQIAIRERAISFSAMRAHVFHNVCGALGIDVDARIDWRPNPVTDRMSLRDERLPEARRRLEALGFPCLLTLCILRCAKLDQVTRGIES